LQAHDRDVRRRLLRHDQLARVPTALRLPQPGTDFTKLHSGRKLVGKIF
jgi:hypothetical protein